MQLRTSLLAFTAAVLAQQPMPTGLKVQWVGHSFHAFLPSPIAKLAAEAKIQGHVNLGMDMLGGSTPCEHWNRAYPEAKVTSGWMGGGMGNTPGGQPLRKVIEEGAADVLTLATQVTMPEPCIAKFVERAVSAFGSDVCYVIPTAILIIYSLRRRSRETCVSWSRRHGYQLVRAVVAMLQPLQHSRTSVQKLKAHTKPACELN